jgi:hypothetical protein
MKIFNKIFFFLSFLYFGRGNAQDVSINILNQPASLYVGSTSGQVTIDICNNDGGMKNAPLNKLRPLISLPSLLVGTTLVSISNVGWQVLSNNGSTMRFENTATIAAGECSQIVLGYTAMNPGGPLTITGTMGFNGPQTVGNLSENDNSTTLMTVIIDTDKDGFPDISDIDDDNDGILDTVEYQACGVGGSATCDSDNDGVPNHLDLDSDNDGINDVNEAGLADVDGNGNADGIIQPNGAISNPISAFWNLGDKDSDSKKDPYDPLNGITPDGTTPPIGVFPVPLNFVNQTTGEVVCTSNCDADKDGILTPVDVISNQWGDALDTDQDNIPDVTDLDDDNDGILDTFEDGQFSADTDEDGIPNRLDLDSDNDGINDVVETGGTDGNEDGIADGTPSVTGIPASAGTGSTPPDSDGDIRPNPYDLDADNDGINDIVESGNPLLVDLDGNGTVDGNDPDGDGILGMADGVPVIRGDINDSAPVDTDGNGKPNYKDLDSDADGLTDLAESGIPNPATLDANADGKIDSTVDPDGDGIISFVDGLPAIFGDANNPVLPDIDADGKPDYVDPIGTLSAKIILKVLLQGALLPTPSSGGLITTGIMRDDLRTAGVIPITEPYTGFANTRFVHVGGGGETTNTAVLAISGNDAIVDWVFVELHDANNPTSVIKTKSALVQRDGDVVEASDGITPVTFNGVVGQNYYVSVKHRNHLGAMTATAILMTTTGTTIDFTNMTAAQTWNNTVQYNGFEQVDVNLKMALWADNTTADNKVKYVGVANDQIPIFSQVLGYAGNTSQQYNYDFATPVYLSGDVNMDAKVKYRGPNNDPAFIFYNVITKYGTLNSASLYNYDLFLEQLP